MREANRRFNSLNTHVIKDRYERAIAVVERQQRGAVPFPPPGGGGLRYPKWERF
jgi:hypothetical protein